MILVNGKFVYQTVEELTYAFLNTMELSTRQDGAIIDKTINDNGTLVLVADKILKANTDPNNIHYAGEQEVMLDPLTNLHILNVLFGLFIDKIRVYENKDMVSLFTEEQDDINRNRMCRYGIKFSNGEEYYSEYYYSRCLGLIELAFLISQENVSVRNFDITPEEMDKIKKKQQKEAEALRKQKAFVIQNEDSENK